MKKVLSMLLAFVMVLGLIPISAMAAGTQTEEVCYEKVTDPINAESGVYLLVADGKAVTHAPGLTGVKVKGNRISGDHSNVEWNVTNNQNGIAFEHNGNHLKIVKSNNSSRSKYQVVLNAGTAAFAANENEGGITLEMSGRFLRIKDGKLTTVSSSYSIGSITFSLYQKVSSTAPDPEPQPEPQPENPEQPETFAPEIQWQRTREYRDTDQRLGQLVTNQTYLEEDNVQKVSWNWNAVRGLKVDENMVVWDYNTRDQIAPRDKQDGVRGATWNNRDRDGSLIDGPASFRRFAGTFNWPAGYTLEDKATIVSVNDANYRGIYDYIENDPELKSRFEGQKVIPINDDLYVYVYRDGENPADWTAEEAEQHMVFWSGTDGRGRWSNTEYSDDGDEWARTTPATYQDKAAFPAYYRSYPNNIDQDQSAYPGETRDMDVRAMKLDHTDGWYTLVNTNALMSTLNKLYPDGMQDNELIHFDIFAFDNNKNGGMDELKIEFEKAPATTAQVTVRYWLNNKLGEPLDTSVMSAVEIGSIVRLNPGTSQNELNYAKAKAITKAQTDVGDGAADYGADGYTVVDGENVINVIYKEKDLKQTAFTYDFGVTNAYVYAAGGSDLTKAEFVGTVPAGFSQPSVDTANGNVTFTYTPQDALGNPAHAALRLTRGTGDQAASFNVQVYVLPASNVLYEENYILAENAQGWNQTGHDAVTVSDSGDNVYGHTSAYNQSAGENGAWSTSMTADALNSKDLTFNFSGIGLDVIGACGPETGKMAIMLNNAANGDYVITYVVDTYYSVENLDQVPLIHAMNLESGIEYQVTVRGIYADRAAAAATYADGMGGPSIDPVVYSTLVDMGLTDEQIMDVQFINMQNELGAGTMALTDGAAAPAAAASPASERVAIDSFRTYHSTVNEGYAKNEQNLIYTNIMDEAIEGDFYAYVEGDAEGSFTTKTYEAAGGPENELYLEPGTGILFQLDDSKGSPYAQISLRAVNGPTSCNNELTISHNTEMYYEVETGDYVVVIANTGDDLLAIGNLKTNCGITSVTDYLGAANMVASFFAMPEPEPEPEPSPEFLVFFELDQWGYSWADGSPRHNAKQFTVTEGQSGIIAPAMNPGEGFKLVGWQAVDQDLLLGEREVLYAQYLEDNFDWTGRERIVIFRPVVEKVQPEPSPEFLVFFELDKWGYSWEDGSPRHNAKQFTVTAEDGGLIAPAMNPGKGCKLVGWQAVDQDLLLGEREVLYAQYLEENFDWTGRERIVIFRPVVEKVFAPETLNVQLTAEKGYTATYVNVRVDASAEVSYITVNGRRVDAANSDWVEAGFDPYLYFATEVQLGRNDEVAVEIVAYDADGNASEVFLAK